MKDGDQDIKTNAITLLNVTWSQAEDNEKAELKKNWEQAGIVEILKVLIPLKYPLLILFI